MSWHLNRKLHRVAFFLPAHHQHQHSPPFPPHKQHDPVTELIVDNKGVPHPALASATTDNNTGLSDSAWHPNFSH